jgi:hypothetical protein
MTNSLFGYTGRKDKRAASVKLHVVAFGWTRVHTVKMDKAKNMLKGLIKRDK